MLPTKRDLIRMPCCPVIDLYVTLGGADGRGERHGIGVRALVRGLFYLLPRPPPEALGIFCIRQ